MNEFKVGLLAISTIAAVVFMSFKITSNQSGFGQYVKYRTIVHDAAGIFPKTPIKVAGISAGRITSIELQGNTALISFEILRQIELAKNSKLRIKSVGFLGDKYIEIHVGDANQKLKNNDFIDSEEAAGMENLLKDTAEILGDMKTIVRSLKDSLSPTDGPSPLKSILSEVAELVSNTREVTQSLRRMAGTNEKKLGAIMDNLEHFSDQLAFQVDASAKGSAAGDVKKILANTSDLTENLKILVADLKNGKGTMGKLLVEDEIADKVKTTLASVQKIVGKVDSLRTEMSVFSGANTKSGAQTEAALRIYPSPERFYHLGVATSEIGPTREQDTVTVTNGVTSNENRKVNDKNTIRFNAQIGRRIHHLDLRGGLIESTGGVGADYNFNGLGAKVSMEAFDYKKGIGPNIRLSTEAQIWNVIYGKLTLDNAAKNSRSGTIQAGLKFSDEDLKGILGFFL